MAMKPVAIFRFSPTEGPGYFATFLDHHSIPWQLFKLDQGEDLPHHPDDYSGLVFMGGPMSVNDDLPWIPPVLELIRGAQEKNQPSLGHCLGGQLISKALGGTVSKNPVKEIGWHEVRAIASSVSETWLGDLRGFTSFQWHGETFTIPVGATRILENETCANQAFVIGNTLGLQCHVEMTEDMIGTWCKDWATETGKENLRPVTPGIQRPDVMRQLAGKNLPELHRIADRLYGKWIEGLYSE